MPTPPLDPYDLAGEDANPYAPPTAPILKPARFPAAGGDLGNFEAIRRKHLSTETNIKALGQLNYLGAVIGGLFAVTLFMNPADTSSQILAVVILGATILNAFLGYGLTHFKNWARWTSVGLMALSLLGQILTLAAWLAFGQSPPNGPLGPVIAILILSAILYILVNRKASVVCTPEYREIIAATPHVKHKTSCLVKGLLGLLIAFFLLIIGSVVFALLFAKR